MTARTEGRRGEHLPRANNTRTHRAAVCDADLKGDGERGHRARRSPAPLTRRRLPAPTTVLLIAAFGVVPIFFNATSVIVAFPAIQSSVHAGGGAMWWLLNSYSIAVAAAVLVGSRFADTLGRKRVFLCGIALFAVASALCALSQTITALAAFRSLQGLGAALAWPASVALVIESYRTAHSARGGSLWCASGAIATGLGAALGGVLVQMWGWRSIFVLDAALGIVAVVAARRYLVESRATAVRRGLSVGGAVMVAVALGLMSLALLHGPRWGWSSSAILSMWAVAALITVGGVIRSRQRAATLTRHSLLRDRSVAVSSFAVVFISAGLVASLLTHVLFLTYVWGYPTSRTGLALAPAALVAALTAALLQRVAAIAARRTIFVTGVILWAAGMIWYVQRVGSTSHFFSAWLPGQLLEGIGIGATVPLLAATLSALTAASGQLGAAVLAGAQHIGAVVGICALAAIIESVLARPAEHTLRQGWVLAAICFAAAAFAAVLLRSRGVGAELTQMRPPALTDVPPSAHATPSSEAACTPRPCPPADADPFASLALFAGLNAARLAELRDSCEQVDVEAGSYLFHQGEPSECLYVVRNGRLQVLQNDVVVRELGRGEVVGELGLLIDAPRSAAVRAVRDSTLLRLRKAQFDKIADAGTLTALLRVLAARLHEAPPPPAAVSTSPELVIAIVAVDQHAPVDLVATELVAALSDRLRVVNPGRVDRDGLERAERAADRVVLHAGGDDDGWRDVCLRVADRVVLVASDPAPPSRPMPARAFGADLVLAGAPAGRDMRRDWETLITPRSVHTVRSGHAREDLRALAARIAGRSVGLVLGGGGARGFAHLGVLDELEAAGIHVDRFAGCSMGAIIAGLGATGMDASAVDAHVYEYFIRSNPVSDYTVPTKGLIRGRRTLAALHEAFGGRLVEELPNEFRCVSVNLLAQQRVVHRAGPLAEAVACSINLPGIFPPRIYQGAVHVDGGVLDNLPVTTLESREGPLIAVAVVGGRETPPAGKPTPPRAPRVPPIGDTLSRTMTIGSGLASAAAMARADIALYPDTSRVGLLEFHQIDRAREAGRIAARQALPRILGLVNR